MLWRTHIRIANGVLRKLGMSTSSVEANRLRDGVVTPDKWKDYPHHEGKSGAIRKYILGARKLFLNDDLTNACFNLGVALHYIQDSYTTLSSRSRHHTRWEQQIEQSYFVDNLEELVASAFHDRPYQREEYGKIAKLLSNEVEGKEETLKLATMPGPGLSSWSNRKWGRPNVDLNFAFRVSFVVAKSVFNPKKTYPKLQTELKHLLMEYEDKLREAENVLANKIVELIEKRDALKKGRKNGVFTTVRNYFRALSSKIYGYRAESKIKKYEQQKHLKAIVRKYKKNANIRVAPHSDWYNIIIPEIDVNIVERRLSIERFP